MSQVYAVMSALLQLGGYMIGAKPNWELHPQLLVLYSVPQGLCVFY